MRDGVIGGSNGDFYEQWDHNSPIYGPEIAQSMTRTRSVEIKKNIIFATTMQKILGTKKVTTPRKNLTSLTWI